MEGLLNALRDYQDASDSVECNDPPIEQQEWSEILLKFCEQIAQWSKFMHTEINSVREVDQRLSILVKLENDPQLPEFMVDKASMEDSSLANSCNQDVCAIITNLVMVDSEDTVTEPVVQTIIGMEFKELPAHLEYVFLNGNHIHPLSFLLHMMHLRR